MQFVVLEIEAASSTLELCRRTVTTSIQRHLAYSQKALDLGWRVLQGLSLPDSQRTELQTRINVLYQQLDALAVSAALRDRKPPGRVVPPKPPIRIDRYK